MEQSIISREEIRKALVDLLENDEKIKALVRKRWDEYRARYNVVPVKKIGK